MSIYRTLVNSTIILFLAPFLLAEPTDVTLDLDIDLFDQPLPEGTGPSDQTEASAVKQFIRLTVGEEKTVDINFVIDPKNGVTSGNASIVSTNLIKLNQGEQIVFKPTKSGQTTVMVRDETGTLRVIFYVKVTGTNLKTLKHELKHLFQDIEGLQFRLLGSKIALDGELIIPSDYGRIVAVLLDKEYAEHVINLTVVSPYALAIVAKKIQVDIQTFAPNVTARVLNGSIFLEGTVDNTDQAKRATQVATYYLPEVKPAPQMDKDPSALRLPTPRPLVQNFIVISPPPPQKESKLIRVDLHFVELAKEYYAGFGFKWAPGFTSDGPQIGLTPGGGDATGINQGPTLTGTLTSLLPKLRTGQQSGYARVLRSGTLIVRSGQPAKLNEQVDYPFQQLGPNGQVTSNSRAVGLSIAVTPSILGQSEDIEMEVNLEQSNLVAKGTNGGPPTTASHKVNTRLYVKSAESAAIAGVMSNDFGSDFNKDDPAGTGGGTAAGATPILNLMHSKSYQKKKSQFVVFVTPQIVESASEGTDDMISNFRMKVKGEK